jgi:hypothetical protein
LNLNLICYKIPNAHWMLVGNEGQRNRNRATKLLLRVDVSNLILSPPGILRQFLKNIVRIVKQFFQGQNWKYRHALENMVMFHEEILFR